MITETCLIMVFIYFFPIQFVLVTSTLTSRFQALSEHLDASSQVKFVISKQRRTMNIARLFDQLCDAIDIVNETFTFHFLLAFPVYMVSF
jgi:hypothetical protein